MKPQALEEATIALAQAFAAVLKALQEPAEPTQPAVKLYTYDDLAEMFGKSKSTIRQWVCAEEFGEPVKVGSSTRVTQEGLDKFIRDHSGPTERRQARTKARAARTMTNSRGQPLGI